MGSLRYVLNAREDFDRARLALRRKGTTSVQRAAWFYQIIRQSYASALTSFGNQPHDLWADFPLIEQAHRRLAKTRTLRSSSGTTTGRRACSTATRPTTARRATTQISERTASQRKTTSVCGML